MERHLPSGQKANLNVLEQVLEAFFSIDQKIEELHKCSSDDFLSLNRTLKNNYKKANYITTNVCDAFDRLGPDKNLQYLRRLKDCFNTLEQEAVALQMEINNHLLTLEKIQANFSLIFVPIKNFGQNLSSLRLLLSNIKLTNNLYDRSLRNFSADESFRIDGVISKVKDSCPVFEENIYCIQNHLKGLHNDLQVMGIELISDILKKIESIRADIEIIEKHSYEVLREKDIADNTARNFNSNMGSIITNLQYHDIIRQKMLHIQQTHRLIIDELNQKTETGSASFQESSNPFYLQIPQIVEIQSAQLLHTNKEYQKAIDQISQKMTNISQDIASIARVFRAMIVLQHNGRSVVREDISDAFGSLLKEKRECMEKYKTFFEDVNLVQKIITNLFEKFRDLEMMEHSIEQKIIDKISFGNLLACEEVETATQAQQIMKLYADNHFEKNKLRTLFTNTNNLLKDMVKSNQSYAYDRRGMEKINKALDEAEESFVSIMESFLFIDSIQQEVLEKSTEISHDCNEVIESVQYYSFFDKTVDNLILKFEKINTLLKKTGHQYFNESEQKAGLDRIEKYYTMKSERIIHKKKVFGSLDENAKIPVSIAEEINTNYEGNDVELF